MIFIQFSNYGKKKKRIQKSWYYECNIARNILLCEKCSYTTYFLILCAKYLHNPTISVYPLNVYSPYSNSQNFSVSEEPYVFRLSTYVRDPWNLLSANTRQNFQKNYFSRVERA